MPGSAGQLDARVLLRRVERGDREAAYDLARLLCPRTVSDLVRYVCQRRTPSVELFDALADAYAAHQEGDDR